MLTDNSSSANKWTASTSDGADRHVTNFQEDPLEHVGVEMFMSYNCRVGGILVMGKVKHSSRGRRSSQSNKSSNVVLGPAVGLEEPIAG
jgi:hypothetical protein